MSQVTVGQVFDAWYDALRDQGAPYAGKTGDGLPYALPAIQDHDAPTPNRQG